VGRDVALLAQVSNLRPGQPGLKRRRAGATPGRPASVRALGRSVVDDGEPAKPVGSSGATIRVFIADRPLLRRPRCSRRQNRRNVSCNRDLRGDHARAQSSADDRGSCAVGVLLAGPEQRAAFLPLPANGSQVNNDVANAIDRTRTLASPTSPAVRSRPATSRSRGRPSSRRAGTASRSSFAPSRTAPGWTRASPHRSTSTRRRRRRRRRIDFAGAGRTVPWVAWYEPNAAFGPRDEHLREPLQRGREPLAALGAGPLRRKPPAVAQTSIPTARRRSVGGRRSGGRRCRSGPVVVWEENDGVRERHDATADLRREGPQQATAGAACPVGTLPAGENNENGFCWQQVGLDRLDPSSPTSLAKGDPTLNVDPTRSGVEPDIAFTGKRRTGRLGRLVRGGPDGDQRAPQQRHGVRGEDRRRWSGRRRLPLARGRKRYCGSDERARHLGHARLRELRREPGGGGRVHAEQGRRQRRENPRVAAGTLTPGNPTVPWVVWQEVIGGGKHAVFVSRLVGGNHFELFNSGQPISNTVNDATPSRHHVLGNIRTFPGKKKSRGSR